MNIVREESPEVLKTRLNKARKCISLANALLHCRSWKGAEEESRALIEKLANAFTDVPEDILDINLKMYGY